jgi:hypothetical protein
MNFPGRFKEGRARQNRGLFFFCMRRSVSVAHLSQERRVYTVGNIFLSMELVSRLRLCRPSWLRGGGSAAPVSRKNHLGCAPGSGSALELSELSIEPTFSDPTAWFSTTKLSGRSPTIARKGRSPNQGRSPSADASEPAGQSHRREANSGGKAENPRFRSCFQVVNISKNDLSL